MANQTFRAIVIANPEPGAEIAFDNRYGAIAAADPGGPVPAYGLEMKRRVLRILLE